jgi:hypothetical protein
LNSVDLNFFLQRSSIKSILNRKKLATNFNIEKQNFSSNTDFYSDYIYDLYLESYELVDVLGSPIYIERSLTEYRDRTIQDVSGVNRIRGQFTTIRKAEPVPRSKDYKNEFNNYEFENEGSKVKIKAIVDFGDFDKTPTRVGNFINKSVRFTLSTLDLVEKNINLRIESDMVRFQGDRYKIVLIRPEKYFNNEIFSLTLECTIESPEVK